MSYVNVGNMFVLYNCYYYFIYLKYVIFKYCGYVLKDSLDSIMY